MTGRILFFFFLIATAHAETFPEFAKKMGEAISKKDSQFIKKILADDVQASFGGDNTREDFISFYKIDSKASPFWKNFLGVLNNGCHPSGENMICPGKTPTGYRAEFMKPGQEWQLKYFLAGD